METTNDLLLYDVLAVSLTTGKVRILAQRKTLTNAESVVKMAVMRRGMETEFFAEVPAGMYQEGDEWKGRGEANGG